MGARRRRDAIPKHSTSFDGEAVASAQGVEHYDGDNACRIATVADVKRPWYSLEYTLEIEAGIAKTPRPPITAKVWGERPVRSRILRP